MMPDLRKVQKLIGADQDGIWGKDSDALLDAAIEAKFPAPKKAVIPDDYWPMLAQIESGNRPYVKATTSSASGLYQFTKATWLGEGGSWGEMSGTAFGGYMPSSAEQLARAKTFTQKNADRLAEAGIPVTKASLYAAHFLGVGTAIKVLKKVAVTQVSQVVGEDQAKANPSILGPGKTVGNFIAWLAEKTSVLA